VLVFFLYVSLDLHQTEVHHHHHHLLVQSRLLIHHFHPVIGQLSIRVQGRSEAIFFAKLNKRRKKCSEFVVSEGGYA